jgi:fatty acid desaturase
MSHDGDILRDPRIRSVPWRDLTRLTRIEVARELGLSLPWLALSLWCAGRGHYPTAAVASFFFFLTGLRQVHNAFHLTLGVSRAASDAVMFVLSVLMLGSMHAVRVNHLRHHRLCMGEGDVEAMSARMTAWRALLTGPLFPLRMHRKALGVANPPQRRWIVAELVANALWVALVFGVLDVAALRYHVLAMALGQCFASFFCVWTVHHDCDRSHFLARTVRNPFKNLVTFNMMLHTEHHLFPQVPTCRLGRLAERLDRAAPELGERKAF